MCLFRLTIRDAPDRSPSASLDKFVGRAWGWFAVIAIVLILSAIAQALGVA